MASAVRSAGARAGRAAGPVLAYRCLASEPFDADGELGGGLVALGDSLPKAHPCDGAVPKDEGGLATGESRLAFGGLGRHQAVGGAIDGRCGGGFGLVGVLGRGERAGELGVEVLPVGRELVVAALRRPELAPDERGRASRSSSAVVPAPMS